MHRWPFAILWEQVHCEPGLTFTLRLTIQLFQTVWDSQKSFEFVNS